MKNNLYFENIKGIGELFLEHIFYEFEMEPILFTCVDKAKRLFLCLCSEIRGKQKWIISECSVDTLQDIINQNIDIASAFCRTSKMIIVEMDIEGKENNYIINTECVDELDLPESGTFLKCDKEAAENYLWNKKLVELHLLRQQVMDISGFKDIEQSYNDDIMTNKSTIMTQYKNIKTHIQKVDKKESKTVEYSYNIKPSSKDNIIIEENSDNQCPFAA